VTSKRQTWRERVRATAVEEIRSTARAILAEHGQAELTTRAVAREMGMSSPAMYRYFSSHEELEDSLLTELFEELTAYTREASEQYDTAMDSLVAASRALRVWALDHAREFEFMLAARISNRAASEKQIQARRDFGGVFLSLVADAAQPEQAPPGPEVSPVAAEAMREFCAQSGVDIDEVLAPKAVLCWIRLYGSIFMATMGRLDAIGEHAGALFEWELAELSRVLGHPGRELPPAT
jgi:AcrR family transcriptional regulator